MLKQLRIKFVCVNMLIVAAMLCVIFGTVFYFTRQSLENESVQALRSALSTPLQPELPGTGLPCFSLRIGPRGELLAEGNGYYDLTDEEFLRKVLAEALAMPGQTGTLEQYGLRYYREDTRPGQRVAFADISGERSALESLARTCAVIGGLSLLAFFLISLLLARWAVRPVERAWAQQRQFVADASHELKTPLTVILTNAELLNEPGRDEAARTRFSDSILTMARQMRGLVEGLLELARVDNGAIRTNMAPLDLSELAAAAVLPFEPLFFERQLELNCQVESGIAVRGSEPHLRQVADILLDNALKYSAAPGAVEFSLKRQGGRCTLRVTSPGEEIPPEELKHIFKRFYRRDKARSMDGSYGLGLSIAEGIVSEHRGRIWAESDQGRNSFFVELPTTQQAANQPA